YISQRPGLAVPAPPTQEPGPTLPVQPAPDVSDLLDQVIAGPGATIDAPSQLSPDVSDLLDQVTADSGIDQDKAAQGLKKEARPPGHPGPTSKPTPRDDTLDLLSEICGEQQTNDER
ncbi:MAG TPA: hypothetical protein VEU97_12610, partial [Ktedonobacteraceae bacterium]|nr:hypothetical protein [Ktedonobacteraceae bacterium]